VPEKAAFLRFSDALFLKLTCQHFATNCLGNTKPALLNVPTFTPKLKLALKLFLKCR
jgi:hypothetical protein